MILVGTSGWQYRHWRDRFYPLGLAQRQWLAHYAARFPTLEINSAFYRLPERSTFAGWREQTPAGFRVAVKMSRYLTHVRRLRDPAEPVARFLDRAGGLGDRLGPVLLQLPPSLPADPGALAATLACFPAGVRVAVEPRHASWWTAPVRRALEAYGAALCWADRRGRPVTPLWRTADFGYLRLHEGAARPWPRYGRAAMRSWVRLLADTFGDGATVYVYFNNDQEGAAPVDAAVFADLCRRHRPTPSTVHAGGVSSTAVDSLPAAPPGPRGAYASVPMVGRVVSITAAEPWDLAAPDGSVEFLATVEAVDLSPPPQGDTVLVRLSAPINWHGMQIERLVLSGRHIPGIVADLLDRRAVDCNAVAVSGADAAGPSPWGADRWRGGLAAIVCVMVADV